MNTSKPYTSLQPGALRRDMRVQPVTCDDPGEPLGKAAFVLAFLFWPVGLVLGILAWSQSRSAGFRNGKAIAAMWVAGVWGALVIILIASGVL